MSIKLNVQEFARDSEGEDEFVIRPFVIPILARLACQTRQT